MPNFPAFQGACPDEQANAGLCPCGGEFKPSSLMVLNRPVDSDGPNFPAIQGTCPDEQANVGLRPCGGTTRPKPGNRNTLGQACLSNTTQFDRLDLKIYYKLTKP